MFDKLYQERCKLINNVQTPVFWKPRDLPKTPVSIFGQTKQYLGESLDSIKACLSRMYALNKHLELDGAAYFVGSTLRKNKDLPEVVKKLLKSNMRDETAHLRAVNQLVNYYTSESDLEASESISNRWREEESREHPIRLVALLETCIFTPVLGFWRLFGGATTCEYAGAIAQDERRHVLTNLGVLHLLDQDPFNTTKTNKKLIHETVDWLYGNFSNSYWNLDIHKEVDNLLYNGNSEQLTRATMIAEMNPHFEVNVYNQHTV